MAPVSPPPPPTPPPPPRPPSGYATVQDAFRNLDILVAGCGETAAEAEEDHDMKLTQLLERCREKNIKLNKEKLHWKRSELSYMGHFIPAEGLKVDPAKVEAIVTNYVWFVKLGSF